MLDQRTKDEFQQKFDKIKPQLKQRFPNVEEQDLSWGKLEPDQLISTLELKTGQPKDQIEQEVKQLVGSIR
jgi:uncharacterized protein YjbJ (UPF0337 family)